jgi:DNA-binding MarR family transcriptional regulator
MTGAPAQPATEDVQWLSSSEQVAWRSFMEGTTRLTHCLDEVLRTEADLTLDDYEILVYLSEADDSAVRMSDLAKRLLTSKSRLTYRFDGLENRGLVCRNRCPDDGRAIHARLTDAGWDTLHLAARIHVTSVREHLLDHFSPQEFELLGAQMKRLVDDQSAREA